MSKSKKMKQYWEECEKCLLYNNGKKVNKIICYECGECTQDGLPLFSELFDPLYYEKYNKKYFGFLKS